jgi:acyl carrier protein
VTPTTPHPDPAALLAELLAGIAPEVDLAAIGPDEDLREAADLDSMDMLNLVTALHEATGIDVPEADVDRLATPAGFAAYVEAARDDQVR